MTEQELIVLKHSWTSEFKRCRAYIAAAADQLSDDQFRARAHPDINSVHLIIRHLAGNLKSRWTDWLTTDGEKPDRDRDREFEDDGESRDSLIRRLNDGWKLAFDAIEALTLDDMGRTVFIRSEPHSIPLAIARQLAHCSYHAGQIMIIARSLVGNGTWQWQTVKPGGSAAFNEMMKSRHNRR